MDDTLVQKLRKLGVDGDLLAPAKVKAMAKEDMIGVFASLFNKFDSQMGWEASTVSEAMNAKNLIRNLRLLDLSHYVSSADDLANKSKRSKVMRAMESIIEKIEAKHGTGSKTPAKGKKTATAKRERPTETMDHASSASAAPNAFMDENADPFQPKASKIARTPIKTAPALPAVQNNGPAPEQVFGGRSKINRTPVKASNAAPANAPAAANAFGAGSKIARTPVKTTSNPEDMVAFRTAKELARTPVSKPHPAAVRAEQNTNVVASTALEKVEKSNPSAAPVQVAATPSPRKPTSKRPPRTPTSTKKSPQHAAPVRMAGERLARTPVASTGPQASPAKHQQSVVAAQQQSAPVTHAHGAQSALAPSPVIPTVAHKQSTNNAAHNDTMEDNVFLQEFRERDRIRQLEEELAIVNKQLKTAKEQEELALHKTAKVDTEIDDIKKQHSEAISAMVRYGAITKDQADNVTPAAIAAFEAKVHAEINEMQIMMNHMRKEAETKRESLSVGITRAKEAIRTKQYELSVLEAGISAKADALALVVEDCNARKRAIEMEEEERLAQYKNSVGTTINSRKRDSPEKEADDNETVLSVQLQKPSAEHGTSTTAAQTMFAPVSENVADLQQYGNEDRGFGEYQDVSYELNVPQQTLPEPARTPTAKRARLQPTAATAPKTETEILTERVQMHIDRCRTLHTTRSMIDKIRRKAGMV